MKLKHKDLASYLSRICELYRKFSLNIDFFRHIITLLKVDFKFLDSNAAKTEFSYDKGRRLITGI